MRILVLPGGSSPYSRDRYRRSYSDIITGLKQASPNAEVEMLLYPGQSDDKGFGIGELTLGQATERVLEILRSGDQEDVRMFCVCFGSIVGVNVLHKAYSAIVRACFYGPLPYWKLSSREFLDEPTWIDSSRGVIATYNIIEGGTSFEDFISHEKDIPIRIAIGSKDDVVIPSTIEYYRSLSGHNKHTEYVIIPDAPHTVSEATGGWNEFLDQCLHWVGEPKF